MESLFPTRRKIPPTGSCLARVNWGQRGVEPSWASWGWRQDRGLSGAPSHDWPVQAVRETACGERAEISSKAAVAVLRASPTPWKEGLWCPQQWAT